MTPPRLRFAPSPTGALHIGGLRTALFNYLYARKHGGQFILRIEDTDQTRFVQGAEDYIQKSLTWLGIEPDESPKHGGSYGPYRQSERKEQGLYQQYAQQLLDSGHAYYAFDTPEALGQKRQEAEAQGQTFKYDARSRLQLDNSLTRSPQATAEHLAQGLPYVIRIKLPQGEELVFEDLIRGTVRFNSDELDDKVLMKEDGMPTYHLANVVDDYLMKITHVSRGEEWLPSTPLHVYLYRYLGWEAVMPVFMHLPLILRPDGKGKLSKRDGAKFGMPVFPLDWPELGIQGFDGWGFLPKAVLNFLALLGWSDPQQRDLLSVEDLIKVFDFAQVQKAGARFDFDKAKWFNQQYLITLEPKDWLEPLAKILGPTAPSAERLQGIAALMRERVVFLKELPEQAAYLFGPPNYASETEAKDLEKKVLSKWGPSRSEQIAAFLALEQPSLGTDFQALIRDFAEQQGLKMGDWLPLLRFALTGSFKGPDLPALMEFLTWPEVQARLKAFLAWVEERGAVSH